MDNQEIKYSRIELEQDLASLREVSTRIDKLTKSILDEGLSDGGVREMVESCVGEQSRIVDKFIGLSDDWDSLKRFVEIVKNIETKTELIENCSNDEEYEKLREEILAHIDEWINCLEIIIVGVLSKLPE